MFAGLIAAVSVTDRCWAQTPAPTSAEPERTFDPNTTPPPTSASEALDRAAAAYQFGDIDLMIHLSRLVAEGALLGNEAQRANALSLLGIGLYLDGRPDGAERAFSELLRLRPNWSLDAKITRPEVVAFFRDVRRKTAPPRQLALAFLPPLGQFQNETPKRGWVIGGVEFASLATAVTTRLLLSDWRGPTGLCRGGDDTSSCDRLRLANQISVGLLATTWAVGVVDALVNHASSDDPIARANRVPRYALTVLPSGAALQVSF